MRLSGIAAASLLVVVGLARCSTANECKPLGMPIRVLQRADMLKPRLEKQFDVIAMYDMSKDLTPEQEQALVKLLKRGIGVVSLHHNLARTWTGRNTV